MQPDGYIEFEGRRILLTNPFRIGRSESCSLPIKDVAASRDHALIVCDSRKGFWSLTDLNSTNGTYVNGLPAKGVVKLSPGDLIEIGKKKLIFQQDQSGLLHSTVDYSTRTIVSINISTRWLLLADIKGSTRLLMKLKQEEVNELVMKWVDICKPIIETAGGSIETFTGDGFLAAWRTERTPPQTMAQVLNDLKGLKPPTGLEFRLVLHVGVVQSGGAMASGIERLAGREINFTFKCEKPVSATNRSIILTHSACESLKECLKTEFLGEFNVDGFDGSHPFYSLSSSCD